MTVENSIKIQKLFEDKVKTLYIADDHHRTQASQTVAKMKRQEHTVKG